MKTIYLVWKNPTEGGINPDWLQLSGKEFLTLVRSLEGKNRYFIKLANPDHETFDSQIIIEATKEAYTAWKKEKNHADYLQKHSAGWITISYHAMGATNSDDEQESLGEELMADGESDFENDFINAYQLEVALNTLTEEERHIIEHFYFMNKPGTSRSYAQETGISKSTANRRHEAAFTKLKKFFENQWDKNDFKSAM